MHRVQPALQAPMFDLEPYDMLALLVCMACTQRLSHPLQRLVGEAEPAQQVRKLSFWDFVRTSGSSHRSQ
jgi:hypothetical protein